MEINYSQLNWTVDQSLAVMHLGILLVSQVASSTRAHALYMAVEHGLCWISVCMNDEWMNGVKNNITKPKMCRCLYQTTTSIAVSTTDRTKHAIQPVFDTHSNHASQIASCMSMKKKEATKSFFSHFFFSDIIYFFYVRSEWNDRVHELIWCGEVCMWRCAWIVHVVYDFRYVV